MRKSQPNYVNRPCCRGIHALVAAWLILMPFPELNAWGQDLSRVDGLALDVCLVPGSTEARVKWLLSRTGREPKKAVPILRAVLVAHAHVPSLGAAGQAAARALARVDRKALYPELDHPFRSVRKATAWAILDHDPGTLRNALTSAGTSPFSPTFFIHPDRLDALGLSDEPTAFDFIAALKSDRPEVRVFALAALRLQLFCLPEAMTVRDQKRFGPRLTAGYKSADPEIRRGTALITPDLKRLLELARDADVRVRRAALSAARWLHCRSRFDTEPFLDSLDDADAQVAAQAAELLGWKNKLSKKTLATLRGVLENHPSPLVRGAAVRALANQRRPQDNASFFLGAMNDPDPCVRWAALQASPRRPIHRSSWTSSPRTSATPIPGFARQLPVTSRAGTRRKNGALSSPLW